MLDFLPGFAEKRLMDIYVHRNGQKHGPYSATEIAQRLHKGLLSPKDLAWYEGLEEWQTVEEIFEKLSAPTAFAEDSSSHASPTVPVVREPIKKRGYRWGYSLGGVLIANGITFLSCSVIVLLKDGVTKDLLFTVPLGVLPFVLGIFIIKRRRWALVSGVVLFGLGQLLVILGTDPWKPLNEKAGALVISMLLNVANTVYIARRWKEMEPRLSN